MPEYEVGGSKDLDFELNPLAALQHVVGGLVSPHPADSRDGSPVNSLRDQTATPASLSTALGGQMERFRESLDTWRKSTRRILSGKLPKDVPSFARSVRDARDDLEWRCIETALFTKLAHEKIRLSAMHLFGAPFELYYAVPDPLGSDETAESAARWATALEASLGGLAALDPDWARMMARAEFLCDEMAETLREVGRQALWLWTNEPTPVRVRSAADWLFDLRCECLEAAPALGALEPLFQLWQASSPPGVQP